MKREKPKIKYRNTELITKIGNKIYEQTGDDILGQSKDNELLCGLFVRTTYGCYILYISNELNLFRKILTIIHEYLHYLIDKYVYSKNKKLGKLLDLLLDKID